MSNHVKQARADLKSTTGEKAKAVPDSSFNQFLSDCVTTTTLPTESTVYNYADKEQLIELKNKVKQSRYQKQRDIKLLNRQIQEDKAKEVEIEQSLQKIEENIANGEQIDIAIGTHFMIQGLQNKRKSKQNNELQENQRQREEQLNKDEARIHERELKLKERNNKLIQAEKQAEENTQED